MKTIVAIGGGELRQKTTKAIDSYIASLAAQRAGENRANALFIPTASHDSLPYFNTFRKTYTSDFGLKCDVCLLTKKDIPMEKIVEKFAKADMLYVGGGDTLFMLDVFAKTGVDKLILDAYNRGVIVAGLSAGAICWFNKMYTDSNIMNGGSDYAIESGLSIIDGIVTPHYCERRADFLAAFKTLNYPFAYALENDSAVVFNDGVLQGSLTSGGSAYKIERNGAAISENKIDLLQ